MSATGIPINLLGLIDGDGDPLAGFKAYFWKPDSSGIATTTPRSVYADPSCTTPAANPVVGSAAGYSSVYKKASEGIVVVLKSSDEATTFATQHYPAVLLSADELDDLGAVRFVASTTEMTALDADGLTDGCVIYVSAAASAGIFVWDATSVASADGDATFAHDSITPGRFIRRPETVKTGSARRTIIRVLSDHPPSIIDYGGVGDGSTSDQAALAACLAANGGCYLPFFRDGTYTQATWKFDTSTDITDNKTIIGDPRQTKVKQGAAKMFNIRGKHIRIGDLRVDASAQSGTGQASFHFDTGNTGIEDVRLFNMQIGMDRDQATLINGYEYIADGDHGSNIIVDVQMVDCYMWSPKAAQTLNDFFASIFIVRTGVDFTRQSAAPSYAGWKVTSGEGIFFDHAYVQGFGTSGTGNSAGHGFEVTGGAAISFNRTRADAVGGIGYKITSVTGVEMVMPIGSLCGEGQFSFASCSGLLLDHIYAGGRSGLAWAPASKIGVKISGGQPATITSPYVVNNTGDGVEIASANSIMITGGQIRSNGAYGVKESGTSNYNGIVGSGFGSNATNNGYFTGAASFISGVMRNSGVSATHSTPASSGAAAW